MLRSSFILVATSLLFFAAQAGDKFYVRKENASNPTDPLKTFNTISAALNSPSVQNGDTVVVYDGTYPEKVNFNNKRVVLGSRYLLNKDRSHIAKTVIDGAEVSQQNEWSDAVLGLYNYTENQSDVQVVGLTITGAKRWAMVILGGTVKDCVFKSNGTSFGYFLVRAANTTFTGCTFEDNRANPLISIQGWNGQVENKTTTIKNSVFKGNIMDNNGDNALISTGYAQDTYVQNTQFFKNTGGHIFSLGGNGGNTGASASLNDSSFISNCLIYDNKSNVAMVRSYERAEGGAYVFINNIIEKNDGNSTFAGTRYFSYRGTSNKFTIGFFNNYIPVDMKRENQQDLSPNALYLEKSTFGSSFRVLFKDTANADYRLADSSFGFGVGLDTLKAVAPRDFNDSVRPIPAGTKVDLGPFENSSALSQPHLRTVTAGKNKAYLSWQVAQPAYDSVQVFRSLDSLGTYAQIGSAGFKAPVAPNNGELKNTSNYIYLGAFGSSKYYLSNKTRVNWKAARQTAQQDGADLVVFETKPEWDFIIKEVRKNMGEWFWIGLYQKDKTKEPFGSWYWVNDLPLEAGYSFNFGQDRGEPNNGGGNEDYGAANETNWIDFNEFTTGFYVVEVDTRQSAQPISYSDTGLVNNTRYYYKLKTKLASSTTSFSNILGAKPNAGYPLPTNINVSNASRNVKVSWTNPVTDKKGTGQYQLLRGMDSTNMVILAKISDTLTAFVDSSLVIGQTYYYRIKTIDSDGVESDYTPAQSIKIGSYVFLSTTGTDNGFGNTEDPVKTFTRAMAIATDGDTVIFKKGTYLFTESQRITKSVVIGSSFILSKDTSDISGTVISSSASIGNVFNVVSTVNNRSFTGLTFRNNQSLFGLENVTIKNCYFINNGSAANSNATLLTINGNSLIQDSRFVGNYGIINLNNNNNRILSNYFEGNVFGSKANNQVARLISGWYGKLTIENNIFIKNGQYVKQVWDGAETSVIGISGWGDTAFISNNSFIQNDAAAITLNQSNKAAVIVNNLFYKNKADFNFEKYNSGNTNSFVYANISNNLLNQPLAGYPNASSYAYGSDSKNNSIGAAVGFKDTVNFRIGPSSAAINAGIRNATGGSAVLYASPTVDYYGNSRPVNKIDIGAEQTSYSFSAPNLEGEGADKKVNLRWNRSFPKIRGYLIFKSTSPIPDSTTVFAQKIDKSDSLSFVDANLTNLTKYYYRIQAYDSSGVPQQSGLSNEVAIIPNVPPGKAENFTGESGPRANMLTWKRAAANHRFTLYRGVKQDSLAILVQGVDTTVYLDRNVDVEKDYFYAIKVTDLGGAASELSSTVKLRPIKTFYVDTVGKVYQLGSAAYPYTTIQTAIDFTLDTDTVLVKPGSYAPFRIGNKSITVKSTDGPSKTNIKSSLSSDYYLIRVDGNTSDTRPYANITVEGFTLTQFNGWRSGPANAAISVVENTSPVFNNLIVRDMQDQNTITVDQSAPSFNNILFNNLRGNFLNLGWADSTQPENKMPRFFNSTFYRILGWGGNGGGERGLVPFVNSIFWGDNMNSTITSSYFNIRSSIVQYPEFAGKNGNLRVDPMFVDEDAGNFSLSNFSPALGKGLNSITVNGFTINAPAFDLNRKARPTPANTKPDLGAYENAYSFPAPTITRLQKTGTNVKITFKYDKSLNASKLVLFRDTSALSIDTVTVGIKDVNKDAVTVDDVVPDSKVYHYALRLVVNGVSSGNSNLFSTVDTLYVPDLSFDTDTATIRFRAGANTLSFVNMSGENSTYPHVLVYDNSYKSASISNRSPNDSVFLLKTIKSDKAGQSIKFAVNKSLPISLGNAGDQMQILGPINLNFDDDVDFATIYQKTGSEYSAANLRYDAGVFKLDSSGLALRFNQASGPLDSTVLPSFAFTSKVFQNNPWSRNQPNMRDAVDMIDADFDGKQEHIISMGQVKWVPKFKALNSGQYSSANNALRIVHFTDINKDGLKDIIAVTGDNWAVGFSSSQGVSVHVFASNKVLGLYEMYRTNLFLDWQSSMIIMDFDNDGRVDILGRGLNNSNYSIYAINNDYTFKTSGKVLGINAYDGKITAGDINNDGFVDVASLLPTGTLNVYLNDQKNAFKLKRFTTPFEFNQNNNLWSAFQLKIMDMNADGLRDIVWAENLNNGSIFGEQVLKVMVQSPGGEVKMSETVSAANAKVDVTNDGYNVKIKWSGFADANGGKLTYNFKLDTLSTYANRMLYTGFNYQKSNPTIPIVLDQVVSSLYVDSVVYKDANISSKYPYYVGVQAVNAFGRASDYKEVTFKPKDPLQKQASSLPGMTNAKFAWGDFNNDGQLDLAVTGLGDENTGRVLKIYKNNNGQLVDLALSNRQLSGGDVKWVDVDKDGWLDLIATGQSGSVPYVLLFKNIRGTFEVSSPSSIPPLKNSTIAMGDHDNNGTVDMVITGQNAVGETQVYLLNNDGKGNFSVVPDFNTKNIIPALYNADVRFIDYDLDGDLDLIYAGTDNNGFPQGGIRLNSLLDARDVINQNFSYQNGLNLKNARFDLGDADSDGDLDILVMGTSIQNTLEKPVTKLIKNMTVESKLQGNLSNNYIYGNSLYTEVLIDSLNNGDVKFADVNNDGLLDISISGLDGKNIPTTKIYLNQGGFGNFSNMKTLELPQFKNSAISWGDYNNDGNMDMVITGAKTVGTETVIYVNDQGSNKNLAPGVPEGLTIADLGLGRVVLKWKSPVDDHTPSKSISYIIKLGTKPGQGDLSTIPVDSTGRLQSPTVPVIGSNEYYLEMPPGQYYWSVMAIDGNFKNSNFSKEQSFILKYPWKYVNQGGIIDRRITPIDNSQFAWADMNNDGLTDFIYLGNSSVSGNSPGGVYKNVGGTFVKIENSNGNGSSGLNGIDNLKNISVKFKDINNDGFVDLFVAGEQQFGNQAVFRVFINKRNFNFTDISGTFTVAMPLKGPAVDFSDLDNNGTADIIYSGTDNTGVGQVYLFTTKIDTANQVPANPNGLAVSPFTTNIKDILNKEQAQNINLAFTDFNLDKRMDMAVLYDNVDGLRKAEIYSGALDQFGKSIFNKNSTINLPKVKSSTLDVVDFNKDGFPDLAISGYSSAEGQTFRIYQNVNDTVAKTYSFVNTASDLLLPVQDGKTTWGDYNMDGYPDVIFSGNRSGSGYVTKMATSTVTGTKITYTELPTFPFGNYIQLTPTMGDINGDGQLGVVLVGREDLNGSITNAFKILQNVRGLSSKITGENGVVSGSAIKPFEVMETRQGANGFSVAADSSSDKGTTLFTLDINGGKIKLLDEVASESTTTYQEKFTENLAPSKPEGTAVSVLGKSGNLNLVKFSWKASKDDLTPAGGLTYSLRIGRSPGKSDLMDPEANRDGTRKKPTAGNTENNFSWDVQLAPGTYYWSVQAVDASYTGSEFSKEAVFMISGDTIVKVLAPTDILLNNSSKDTVFVAANANTAGSKYKLTTVSPDTTAKTFSYKMSDDNDPSINSLFGIDSDNNFFVKSQLQRSDYVVRIISTDPKGLAVEKAITFLVIEAPTNILLDGNNTSTVSYGAILDSAKLTIALTGIDARFAADKLTYSLVDGDGADNNAWFSIKEGNKLFNKATLKLVDTIRIRIAVSNGIVSYEKQVKIISTCQFSSVKFTNSKPEPFKICEGEEITMGLGKTATALNLFKDNVLIGSFSNVTELKINKPGKYYAIYAVDGSAQCGNKTDSIFVQYNLPVTQVAVNGLSTICSNSSVSLTATAATGYTFQWLRNDQPIQGATGANFTANTAGKYAVKVTNSQSCSGISAGVNINVISAPDATMNIKSDTTICAGTALNVSVPAGANSYVWVRDGVEQQGGSNTFNFTGTGNLWVVVTGSNGCKSTAPGKKITTVANPNSPAVSVNGSTSICAGSKVLILGQVLSGVTYQWLKDGTQISGATEANYAATVAGVYQLQVTNQSKCSAKSEVVTMKVAPAPARPSITRDQTDLVATTASGYQWYNSQAEAIIGATDQKYRPSLNGTYTVKVSVNGCESMMSEAYYYLATSLVNLGNDQYIRFFPNPVVSGLGLEFRISGLTQVNVRVYDITGKLVVDKVGLRTGTKLQLGGLAKGTYLIKVARKDGRELMSEKLIKQ